MKRHGKGKLVLHKGGSFEGDWKEDYIVKGTLELQNGYIYEGAFQKNLIHGHGVLKEPNGEIYTGSFNQGKKEGSGTIKFNNGNTYSGSFRNNQIEGRGKLIF